MKVTIISSDRRNRLRSLRSKTKKVGLNSSSVAANSALIYLNYFHVTEIHHSVGSEIQNPARDKGAMPMPLQGRPGPLRAPVEGLDGAHCPSGCHTQKRFAPEALGTGRAPWRCPCLLITVTTLVVLLSLYTAQWSPGLTRPPTAFLSRPEAAREGL